MLAAHKRRPSDFKRRIIKRIYTNKIDLFASEQYYLNQIKKEELRVRYYNLQTHWEHWASSNDEYKKASIKEKISQRVKEAMQREDVREKCRG
jgi:hypothetical protein